MTRSRENGTRSLGLRVVSTVCIALLLFSPSVGGSQTKETRYSTLDGGTIRMEPFSASFRIPLDWTKEYNAVTVVRAQLEKVRKARGEWYKEYASVVNSSLPFSNCSVQAGTYAWDSSTFSGLQLRGYLLDSGRDRIEASIATKGLTAAKALRASVRNAAVTRDEQRGWHRILITYDVWYGDYGGKAYVEYYVTTRQAKTIVMVFMYAGSENRSVIQQILDSFSWGSGD